jgi:transposase
VRVHRYPSDNTDAEWRLIAPLLPVPACQMPTGGRPEAHDRREVVDAIRYLVDNGCKWRALPADFPPWRTVYGFFSRWHRAGVLARIRDALLRAVRLAAGYCPLPVAVVIDSQTVRAAETVARSSRGYDAAKRINGRKRSVAVDLGGLLVATVVSGAGVEDRDIARDLLARLHIAHPQVPIVWADGAYRGELVRWAAETLRFRIETVTRPAGTRGFVVLPRLLWNLICQVSACSPWPMEMIGSSVAVAEMPI